MHTVKRQIAETFERLVNDRGYDKATLDEVARELKISKKTIYVHFDGKQDIYAQLVARQAQRDKKRLAALVTTAPTYAQRVEIVARAVLDAGRAHISATSKDEWLREYEIAADAFRVANGELLRELVQGGMDAGEFAPGDATLVEKMIAAMVIEYLLLVNTDPTYDRDSELLKRIGDFVG